VRHGRGLLIGLFFTVVGAALMYLTLAGRMPGTLNVAAESPAPVSTVPQTVVDLQQSVVRSAEVVGKSVVNIDVTATVQGRRMPFPFPPGHPQEAHGEGSGVIISEDGWILTNDHVVRGASQIDVTMSDGRKFKGTVKGADAVSDLALVKVDATGLPASNLGDSDALPVGSFVIAVGNPLGFDQTVTMGVLSGRGREIPEPGKEFRNLLQTDAAINPGNSGGPLADLEGRVIGINTAIIPRAQGMGFAIPINHARDIMTQLRASGRVIRPFVGIAMQEVDEEVAAYLRLPRVEGVLVLRSIDGGPAARAGIVRGDVVVEIDGKPVNEVIRFQETIRAKKVGDSVTLKVWGQGRFRTVTLKLAEMP